MWGFHKAVCPLLITHNIVGVLQSSLPSADYPRFHKAVCALPITQPTILWGFHKAVCPLLINRNTVGVSQSSFPSADYTQYCGGFAKQFALC